MLKTPQSYSTIILFGLVSRAISLSILPPLKATLELWAFCWAVLLHYWRLQIRKGKRASMWQPPVAILRWCKYSWVKDPTTLVQIRYFGLFCSTIGVKTLTFGKKNFTFDQKYSRSWNSKWLLRLYLIVTTQ